MPTFPAILQLHGKTATGIEVPEKIVSELGSGKRPAVRATIAGHQYRTTVAVMGGKFMMPVSADVRAAAAVAAGDEVDVTLELDTEPRTVELPAELAAALTEQPDLKAAFDKLSFSHQREHADAINAAKKPETRQRRVAKALAMLRERVAKP